MLKNYIYIYTHIHLYSWSNTLLLLSWTQWHLLDQLRIGPIILFLFYLYLFSYAIPLCILEFLTYIISVWGTSLNIFGNTRLLAKCSHTYIFFISEKVCQEIMLPLALAYRQKETEALSPMTHKKLKVINNRII